MSKRYSQVSDGIFTSGDALIFVGCSVIDDLLGEEEWGLAAFVFSEEGVRVLTKTDVQDAPYPEEDALYDAIRLALAYCKNHQLKVVDIIYDSDELLVTKLPAYTETKQKINELNADFRALEINIYRTNVFEVQRTRLIDALRRETDKNWVQNLEAEAVFVTLVKELARAILEDDDLAYDISNKLIYFATDVKKVRVTHDWPFGDAEPEEDEKKLEKRTILDFILERAESIKKTDMTVYHLLYGYACFCNTPDEEIRKDLDLDKEELTKAVYAKDKMIREFSDESVKIIPEKLMRMIPQYIDWYEEEVQAIDDYELAMASIREWRKSKNYADEVIAFSMLNLLLKDGKRFNAQGINHIYLHKNGQFGVGIENDDKEGKAESLEEVAQKSTELYDVLSKHVFGQEFAVQKFVKSYVNSRLQSKSRRGKPLATYLFAGPPGVGKSYLSGLVAKTLGIPMKIFDMSEYPEEHSVYGLIGFDYTWKDSTPGVLTTFVSDNPVSILLIDEIEKAHKSVQLQFLQILEGARLTDRYYNKEINFEQTILIFTTNCGKQMYEDNENSDLSSLSETEIIDALKEEGAFPSELCSRFASGNIIMFNHLQTHYLVDIVRNKMESVAEEMKENYHLNVTLDKYLPEMFLFQLGSGADARVASSQSSELIKEMVVDFVKEQVEKAGNLQYEDVSFEILLDRENKEVYSCFENEEECNVLVVSDSNNFKSYPSRFNIVQAVSEQELLQIIWDNPIHLAIIDLNYKTTTVASNAMGMDSVGMNCLELLKDKAPQIPIYVVKQENYGAEDRKEILTNGVRELFEQGENEEACLEQIRNVLGELYVQKKLTMLKQKGQRLEYKTRYLNRNGVGVIEFYDLWLRAVGADDAALRRKAKQSKVFDFERPEIRFSDIIGAELAKRDMNHFIQYMHNIDKYVMEGAEIPKGVLLYGPPGTGKTSLAKALAGECDALFLNTTGASIRNASDPIGEIKDLFKIAYANAPTILFIDEIDVIAKERTGYDTGTELLVNTLLTEMEGFSDKDPFKPVFVVAATNYNVEHRSGRPNEIVIDPALVRRFDNPVYVGLPSREERKQYVQMLLKKKHYEDKISDVALDYVAEHTGGKSLAYLKRMLSNMTNRAIDENRKINDDLLTETLETQLYGEKRDSDEAYRLSVARHEAGHAFVAFKTGREPKFITIVSRGDFGGYVSYGDGEEVHNLTKEDFLNFICQALAGRATEMVYYGEKGVNTGASSDLDYATKQALRMLCYFGMGNIGLLSMDPEHILETPKGEVLLEEANKILEQQLERAMQLIRANRKTIDRVVDVLMDKSYIQGENLRTVLEEGEQEQSVTNESKGKPKKWYVVVNGHKPGIYTTWAECQAQVSGYSNAIYRSYLSEEEAKKAFSDSRIGVKNIRDKKLLYYPMKLSDFNNSFWDGILPKKEVQGKKYVSFDFHAYAPEAVKMQKENPEESYVFACISRARAEELGYQILIEHPEDQSIEIYDFKTGMDIVDWKQMEQMSGGSAEQINVQCICEKIVPLEEIQYIYVPDEESAKQLMYLCPKGITISVNKRMFVS